jgi:hypothetical protein
MTMTLPQTAALAGRAPTVPPEARHRHDNACYWDVDDCRWQCGTHPLLGDALECCTATGGSAGDNWLKTKL